MNVIIVFYDFTIKILIMMTCELIDFIPIITKFVNFTDIVLESATDSEDPENIPTSRSPSNKFLIYRYTFFNNEIVNWIF